MRGLLRYGERHWRPRCKSCNYNSVLRTCETTLKLPKGTRLSGILSQNFSKVDLRIGLFFRNGPAETELYRNCLAFAARAFRGTDPSQGAKAVIPRELIGTAQVPGGEELRLYRHDRDFMIVLDRNELMSSRLSGSEIALAEQSCARIADAQRPAVLIGGYGMGFTLRAALAKLPKDSHVTVAELVPEIIEWARGPMQELAAGCLDDPRVRLVMTDVADVIRANGLNVGGTGYDAILLDVDNGPDGLVRAANNQLYSTRGLRAARSALRPGGVLAIWSAAKDPNFTFRLKHVGFDVEEIEVRARSNGKGAKHVIWFARD